MADGEADIDPDGPDLNQIQMEQLAKSVAIMDAADQEQLTTLYNDRKRYTDMLVQVRRLYHLRIAALILTCIGLLLILSGITWFAFDDQNHLKYLRKCEWSDWEDNEDKGYSYREICGAIQYGPLLCDTDCKVDNKHVYTRTEPPEAELARYQACPIGFTDQIYIKIHL